MILIIDGVANFLYKYSSGIQNGVKKMDNFKSLLTFSTAISLAVAVVFSGNLKAETVWLEQDDFKTVAQGDKDTPPNEFVFEELSDEDIELRKAAANPQEETIDDQSIPSLTTEGGFLLPTYILPEADGVAPEKAAAVDNQNPWRKPQPESSETPKKTARAGVALRGISPTAQPQSNLGEKALLENIEKQYQNTAALLENTEKRLAALEQDIQNYAKNKALAAEQEAAEAAEEENCEEEDDATRGPLLLPLAPLRTIEKKEVADDDTGSDLMQSDAKKDYVDFIIEAIERSKMRRFNPTQSDEAVLRSIPKEMRISFLHGSADLSNQAFKWIKVFSYNPQRTVGSAVEIRLSPKDLDLQSRRFALIKGALLSNGLTPRQIRFVFTDRDCDSVVLRNIQLPENQELLYQAGKDGAISQQIIQKW